MNFSTQFDSPIHGLCWVDARPDTTTTNFPQWEITEARDEEGQRISLNGGDHVRATAALDEAWADSLGIEPPAAIDFSFDELPEEHYFEVLS
jgi:hypothetical protein